MPISAVMAEPARAVIIMAVSTGPSSMISERETSDPTAPAAPNCHQSVIGLQAQHHTVKQVTSMMMVMELAPMLICLLNDTGKLIASGDTSHCLKQKNCGGSQAADPGDHRPAGGGKGPQSQRSAFVIDFVFVFTGHSGGKSP